MDNVAVIDRRSIILRVRDKWIDQYRHYGDDARVGWGSQPTAGEIRARLRALDLETCSAEDVDAALEVTKWAANECDICGADCEVTFRLGDEPDYEARWVDVCKSCLEKAASLPSP